MFSKYRTNLIHLKLIFWICLQKNDDDNVLAHLLQHIDFNVNILPDVFPKCFFSPPQLFCLDSHTIERIKNLVKDKRPCKTISLSAIYWIYFYFYSFSSEQNNQRLWICAVDDWLLLHSESDFVIDTNNWPCSCRRNQSNSYRIDLSFYLFCFFLNICSQNKDFCQDRIYSTLTSGSKSNPKYAVLVYHNFTK